MKTQAVVIPEPNKVELQDVTLKAPGPDEVTIHTAHTSISAGTERMLLAGQMPHPMLKLPVVPGYETVGRITAVGDNVSDDWLDRWVYIGGAMCYDGINAAWGGQSATIHADVNRVIPLDGVEPRQGVLLALGATALHGIDLLDLSPGHGVLVIGQGPVGQLAARLAVAQGAWVVVADRNPKRLTTAVADQIIDVSATPLDEGLTEQVDIIIEASGSMTALENALPRLANEGMILLLGYYTRLELPYMPLFLKEVRLLTAKEWAAGDLNRVRDMIADGDLEVASLLTHDFPISQVTDAYDTAMNDTDCMKVVLNW